MTPNAIIPEPNPGSSQPAPGDSGRPPAGGQTGAKTSGTARPDGFPLAAATVSVLAHAVVIAILLNTPLRAPMPVPDTRMITMHLLPRPAIEKQAPVLEDPSPTAQIETEAATQPATKPAPEPVVSAIADEPPTADEATDESTDERDPARAGALRANVLEQVRALPAEFDGERGPVLPWTSSGEPVPGMPGVRGWISAHVGTVAPSAQTWKENDGSSRGRYVLANGTVVCTRRRAPTIDELMNPWKSTAVTMGSICGRERPDAPDFSDPRVQPPPTVVGTSPSDDG